MARIISGEYRLGRRLLTGVADPSGLALEFSLDGARVFTHLEADKNIVKNARVIPPGFVQNVVDDLAHATVAALRKRIGVTRESRVRFLKPVYAGNRFRIDGTIAKEAGELVTVSARLTNERDQLCVEADIEVFLLGADQVRRMTPDGMLPRDLRRFFE